MQNDSRDTVLLGCLGSTDLSLLLASNILVGGYCGQDWLVFFFAVEECYYYVGAKAV